jgi:tetratricopeptide (TPR) repeat protein
VRRVALAGILLFSVMSKAIVAATRMLEQVISACAQSGARSVVPYFLTGLAEGQRRAGRLDDALATVDRAIAHAQQFEHRMYDSLLYRLRGEITAARYDPHHEDSIESFRRAIEIAQTTHARQLELEALLASRRFGAALDDPPTIRDALCRAVERFAPAVTTRALDEARGILVQC